jgi:hypothetical protein
MPQPGTNNRRNNHPERERVHILLRHIFSLENLVHDLLANDESHRKKQTIPPDISKIEAANIKIEIWKDLRIWRPYDVA